MSGPWLGVAAPGENIVSVSNAPGGGLANGMPNDQLELFPISGTSYAAAYVSGVAALVRSKFPELTAEQVVRRITATANGAARSPSNLVGAGSVDPVAALTWDLPEEVGAACGQASRRATTASAGRPDTADDRVRRRRRACVGGAGHRRGQRASTKGHRLMTARITLALLFIIPAAMAYPWPSTRDRWVLGVAIVAVVVLFAWWRGLFLTTMVGRRVAYGVAAQQQGRRTVSRRSSPRCCCASTHRSPRDCRCISSPVTWIAMESAATRFASPPGTPAECVPRGLG